MTTPDQSSKDILVKINNSYKRIKLEDIYYLKAEGKYVGIYLKDRNYSFKSSLKNLETTLPHFFVRTHTSYVANISKIQSINTADSIITMDNGNVVSLSRSCKGNIFDKFLAG